MGIPATTGVLCSNINDMEIGDYIICKYVAASGALGVFSDLGSSVAAEIPVIGASVPNGTFYFVKAARGLLIPDRNVQHTVAWDALNTGRVIQGAPQTFGAVTGIIRSLTGGVSYADVNGNSSTVTTLGFGAFPINNEWDKYIVRFPIDKIQEGKMIDDIFHWKNIYTNVQDTPALAITASSQRILRGGGTASEKTFTFNGSSASNATQGFRPVFEYRE